MTLRGLPGRVALAGASVLLVALLAEGALRLFGWTPERHRAPAHLHATRTPLTLDCYPTNPRGYFDVDLREASVRERYQRLGMPRVEVVARRAPFAVEVKLNALRFRDRELEAKPAGVTRVMVLGDSFTEGQGVREVDTLPRRLERLLDADGAGRVEVRNCGRRATDFPQLFRNFEAILAFEPDVVVHAMVLNDAERAPAFAARQRYLNDWIVDQSRWADPEAPAFGFLDSRLLAFTGEAARRFRVGRESTRWYREMYGPANAEGWAHTQGYLRQMDRRMRARGGRFLVALWPLLVGLDRGYPFEDVHRALDAFLSGAGIEHVDFLPALRGRRPADLWVYPVDMHPNAEANRLAAEALAPVVRPWLPSRELARQEAATRGGRLWGPGGEAAERR
jgi:lysophospholipase L1-like esterase